MIIATQNGADELSRYFLFGEDDEEDVEEPGIFLNNVQIDENTAAKTSDKNLEALRGWIVSGSNE